MGSSSPPHQTRQFHPTHLTMLLTTARLMQTEYLSGKSIWFHLRILILWCSLKPLVCLRWTKVPTSPHWSSQGMQGKNFHGSLSQWGVVPSLGCLFRVTTAVSHMWSLSTVSEHNDYISAWMDSISVTVWMKMSLLCTFHTVQFFCTWTITSPMTDTAWTRMSYGHTYTPVVDLEI